MSIVNDFKFIKTIDAIKKNNFRVPVLPKVAPYYYNYEDVKVAPLEHNYIYVNEVLDFLIDKIKEKENHIKELEAFY